MPLAKYLVLKEGKRNYTLVSLHFKGAAGLREAHSSAVYTANKDNTTCYVCDALEIIYPNTGIIIREPKEEKK